jgi:hypothetical protein
VHVAQRLPAFGESDVSENEHSLEEEKARATLMEIAKRHLTGAKYEIHTVSASARALAKAMVHVATEVNADLIVLNTMVARGFHALFWAMWRRGGADGALRGADA